MSDLFHADVPAEFVARVWEVMERGSPTHLSKMTEPPVSGDARVISSLGLPALEHVWLGTSVEDGAVLSRLDDLESNARSGSFCFLEPLIGSVRDADLGGIHWAIVGGEFGPRARPMDGTGSM